MTDAAPPADANTPAPEADAAAQAPAGPGFRIVRRVIEVNTRCYPSNVIFV